MDKILISNDDMMDMITKQLDKNSRVSFRVIGDSMFPFFKNGKTIVTVEKTNEVKLHDVILFNYDGQIVLHRIIKMVDEYFICQGDGAFRKEYVIGEDIYGKVTYFYEPGKQIKHYETKLKLWLLFSPIKKFLLKIFKNKQ